MVYIFRQPKYSIHGGYAAPTSAFLGPDECRLPAVATLAGITDDRTFRTDIFGDGNTPPPDRNGVPKPVGPRRPYAFHPAPPTACSCELSDNIVAA